MNRGMPSMVALLGMLAVAGYQNRDKIAEMLGNAGQTGSSPARAPSPSGGLGDVLGRLGGLVGGSSAGSVLSGGLTELLERFSQNGHGQTAQSWINTGPNAPVSADQLEEAIGPEAVAALVQHTGLTREELLARLTRELPSAVDKFTPQGRIPTSEEANQAA